MYLCYVSAVERAGATVTVVCELVVKDKGRLGTQLFLVTVAFNTVATGVGETAQANKIADLVARGGTGGYDLAYDLATRDDGTNGWFTMRPQMMWMSQPQHPPWVTLISTSLGLRGRVVLPGLEGLGAE